MARGLRGLLRIGIVSILPSAVARDQEELFVTNQGNSVTVYARTANGNVAPLRTIAGPLTGLNFPNGIFADITNGEIFVANQANNSITV